MPKIPEYVRRTRQAKPTVQPTKVPMNLGASLGQAIAGLGQAFEARMGKDAAMEFEANWPQTYADYYNGLDEVHKNADHNNTLMSGAAYAQSFADNYKDAPGHIRSRIGGLVNNSLNQSRALQASRRGEYVSGVADKLFNESFKLISRDPNLLDSEKLRIRGALKNSGYLDDAGLNKYMDAYDKGAKAYIVDNIGNNSNSIEELEQTREAIKSGAMSLEGKGKSAALNKIDKRIASVNAAYQTAAYKNSQSYIDKLKNLEEPMSVLYREKQFMNIEKNLQETLPEVISTPLIQEINREENIRDHMDQMIEMGLTNDDRAVYKEWHQTSVMKDAIKKPEEVMEEKGIGDFYPSSTVKDWEADILSKSAVDPKLTAAVMWQESKGKAGAVSPTGVKGLMQITSGTAKELGIDRNDPVQSIEGGSRYLKQQLDKFDGNVELALSAYNAGPTATAKAVKMSGKTNPSFSDIRSHLKKIVGPNKIKETSTYVKNIMNVYGKNKQPTLKYDYGKQLGKVKFHAGGNLHYDYSNTGARRYRLHPEFENTLQKAFPSDWKIEVFSGGQPKKGDPGIRGGTTRHDTIEKGGVKGGFTADVRIRDENGSIVKDKRLAPYIQNWVADGGNVGAFMGGGGIHLDMRDLSSLPGGSGRFWAYPKGAKLVPWMYNAVHLGLAGKKAPGEINVVDIPPGGKIVRNEGKNIPSIDPELNEAFSRLDNFERQNPAKYAALINPTVQVSVDEAQKAPTESNIRQAADNTAMTINRLNDIPSLVGTEGYSHLDGKSIKSVNSLYNMFNWEALIPSPADGGDSLESIAEKQVQKANILSNDVVWNAKTLFVAANSGIVPDKLKAEMMARYNEPKVVKFFATHKKQFPRAHAKMFPKRDAEMLELSLSLYNKYGWSGQAEVTNTLNALNNISPDVKKANTDAFKATVSSKGFDALIASGIGEHMDYEIDIANQSDQLFAKEVKGTMSQYAQYGIYNNDELLKLSVNTVLRDTWAISTNGRIEKHSPVIYFAPRKKDGSYKMSEAESAEMLKNRQMEQVRMASNYTGGEVRIQFAEKTRAGKPLYHAYEVGGAAPFTPLLDENREPLYIDFNVPTSLELKDLREAQRLNSIEKLKTRKMQILDKQGMGLLPKFLIPYPKAEADELNKIDGQIKEIEKTLIHGQPIEEEPAEDLMP